jgi:arylsulfatase
MDTLEKRGRLNNTVILFTSDHGDCLGDHGHIQKWTMYEPVVRVPAIFWGPGLIPAGRQHAGMVQHFDLAAILLELAGTVRENDQRAEGGNVLPEIEMADTFDIFDLSRDYVYAEHSRDHILEGTRYMTMIRDQRYKLVHYLGDAYGELYDTKEDPDEILNLWNNPCAAEVKNRLIGELLNWRLEEDFRSSRHFHRDR